MRVKKALVKGPLGFGAAPLGNMFRNIPDGEASATVEAAWDQGTRYFDTAPFYGAGLSEIRLGKILSKHNRDEYYKVPIKAAALQFSLAHPAVAAVIPGASRPERIAEDHVDRRSFLKSSAALSMSVCVPTFVSAGASQAISFPANPVSGDGDSDRARHHQRDKNPPSLDP